MSEICGEQYNYNSKMAVHLIECQIKGEQYTGTTKTKLRSRQKIYKRNTGCMLFRSASLD